MQRKGHQSIKMSLSEEDRLLLNDNYRIRIYGSVDDSSSSDTLLSSGSFQIEDDATTDALNHCNRLLHGYKTGLKVIGWYRFVENPSCQMKLWRAIWISAIFLFILIALGAQAMSCFRRDLFNWINATNRNDLCGEHDGMDELVRCDISFVSTFVIPAILLLLTYLYGIYIFWGTHEYLENLAGQVFIQNKDLGHSVNLIVRKIILYFSLGLLYIVISLLVRIFHSLVFNMFDSNVAICWQSFGHLVTGAEKYVFLIVSLIGFIFFDGVYISAIINYAIQSELNISLLHSISKKVKNRKYHSIDLAMKDINMANSNVTVLNGRTATAVALVLFNFVSGAIQGIITLGDVIRGDGKGIAVITMSAVLWTFLGVVPFVQATRVTIACTNLLSTATMIRTRPLSYRATHQLDLDSFCIFTLSLNNMRAEIFGVPILPWTVYLIAATFAFVMLLLCQNGIYQYTKWL